MKAHIVAFLVTVLVGILAASLLHSTFIGAFSTLAAGIFFNVLLCFLLGLLYARLVLNHSGVSVRGAVLGAVLSALVTLLMEARIEIAISQVFAEIEAAIAASPGATPQPVEASISYLTMVTTLVPDLVLGMTAAALGVWVAEKRNSRRRQQLAEQPS